MHMTSGISFRSYATFGVTGSKWL